MSSSSSYDRRSSFRMDRSARTYHSEEVKRQARELMRDMNFSLGDDWRDYTDIVYEKNDAEKYYFEGRFVTERERYKFPEPSSSSSGR